jgi:hypothetical protein
LNVPTSQTDIDKDHRLRHRILLQDESIQQCDFQTGEVKPSAPANFSFPKQLSFHFYEISTNQPAFEPTSFLNVPTSQTDIEEHLRLRHRILLQDESIHWCDFQTSEVKRPAPANFAFAELSFHFHEISTNQLAF